MGEASDILLNAGVAPDRICISHIGIENREEYVLALLKKGVYVEFDNFGKATEEHIGLRIEDVVCVKQGGAENLTNYPRKLFEIDC